MSEELKKYKNCPFCGSNAVCDDDLAAPRVTCLAADCALQHRAFTPIEWNTRAVSPELASLKAEVEKLKAGNLKAVDLLGELVAHGNCQCTAGEKCFTCEAEELQKELSSLTQAKEALKG